MDSGEASGRKKRPAKGSRAPARRAALSDSDEELSSEEGSELEYEPEPAPKSSKRARPQAKGQPDDGSGDDEEAAAFSQADLIEDEEDAARLAQMTELEREFELAERSERRQQEIQRRKLLRQAQGLKPPPSPAPETEGPASTPAATRSKAAPLAGEQGGRSMRSGREEREEAAKKTAIQELVAARKSRAEARTFATGDSSDDEGDRDDRARSESEEDEEISDLEEDDDEEGSVPLWQRRAGAADEEEEEAGYKDACSIVVPRRRLEKWLGEPFFETTLPGCLVRVSLGTKLGSDGLQRQHYMLAQVVDVEQRKPGVYKDCGQAWHSPYPFGPAQEPTDAWLRVCRGTSERGMPLALVSNASPSEAEWEGWQRACTAQHRPQLSRGEVAEVAARIHKAQNYVYTAADVTAVLERKRAAGKAARNAALERARLERQRDAATEAGDAARVEQLNAELDALQREVEAKSARRLPAVGMEDINRKNRNINFQASKLWMDGGVGRNALHAVSNKIDEPHSHEAVGTEGKDTLDPFSRRVTRPQNYWSTKGGAEEEEEAVAGEAGTTTAADDDAAEPAAGPATTKTEEQEAIVDLSGLNLSLLDRPPVMHPLARRLLGSSVARLVIAANAVARSRA